MDRCCRTCASYCSYRDLTTFEELGHGTCRRRPPTLRGWPHVAGLDWCAAHRWRCQHRADDGTQCRNVGRPWTVGDAERGLAHCDLHRGERRRAA